MSIMLYIYIGGTLLLLGWIVNYFDRNAVSRIRLTYDEYPSMRPIRIPTKGKGFWGAVWMWFGSTRNWEITKDWKYKLNGAEYCIPKGFTFDGASMPKFARSWLSPVGVMLIGGLIHDYGYKYQTLLYGNKESINGIHDQKYMDQTFRDVNIDVNGFKLLNYACYYMLRLFGFLAWNGHRKRNCQWEESVKV